jgi:hypothetical protein
LAIKPVVGPAYALSTSEGHGKRLVMRGNNAICWVSVSATATGTLPVYDAEWKIVFGRGSDIVPNHTTSIPVCPRLHWL